MNVSPVHTHPMLRLARPQSVDPVTPTQRTPAAQPVQPTRSAEGDSFSFSSVYESQLPRMPLTEAHHRLDRIRSLVGAQTDVPIHFDGQPVRAASANPYAPTYASMRLPADPADFNAAVTEQQVGDSNSTERLG